MPLGRLAISLTLDGRAIRSETVQTLDGAYGVGFSTTLPDDGLGLHSTFQGAPRSDTTAIGHVLLRGAAASTEVEQRDTAQLPVDRQLHQCLYHHLHRLQDLAAEGGLGELAAHGLDGAADVLAID